MSWQLFLYRYQTGIYPKGFFKMITNNFTTMNNHQTTLVIQTWGNVKSVVSMKSLITIIFIQNLSKECKLLYLLIKIKKEKAKKKKMATLCPPPYKFHYYHFLNHHLKFDVTKYWYVFNKMPHHIRRHWTYAKYPKIILINKSVTFCRPWRKYTSKKSYFKNYNLSAL